jgi:hypothetical protein
MIQPRRVLVGVAGRLAWIAIASIAGCDANDPKALGPVRGPLPHPEAADLVVAAEPVLSLTDAGDIPFFRISTGAFLGDSMIVVANDGSSSLLFLSLQGSLVAVAGRRGGGPGEFTRIRELRQVHEGIAAWDARLRRVSIYAPDGRHLRDVRIDFVGATTFAGELSRSEWAFVADGAAAEPAPRPPVYEIWAEGGRRAHHVSDRPGHPPAAARFPWTRPDGQRVQRNHGIRDCFPAYHHAVARGKLLLADGASGEVSSIDLDGSPRVVHVSRWRRVVSPDEHRYVSERLQAQGAPKEAIAAALNRIPLGDILVVWKEMLVSPTGTVWLGLADCRPPTSHRFWEIIDAQGEYLGLVQTPTAFRVLAVEDSHVLGVATDSLGVEHLEMYRLVRRVLQ